jgi:hypothetical protein
VLILLDRIGWIDQDIQECGVILLINKFLITITINQFLKKDGELIDLLAEIPQETNGQELTIFIN